MAPMPVRALHHPVALPWQGHHVLPLLPVGLHLTLWPASQPQAKQRPGHLYERLVTQSSSGLPSQVAAQEALAGKRYSMVPAPNSKTLIWQTFISIIEFGICLARPVYRVCSKLHLISALQLQFCPYVIGGEPVCHATAIASTRSASAGSLPWGGGSALCHLKRQRSSSGAAGH